MKNFNSLFFRLVLALCLPLLFVACDSGSDLKDLIDVGVNPPDRKPIDVSQTGVNSFFVDRQFGSIASQFSDIRDTLDLRHVRVLFAWTDGVQGSASAEPNYSFYDDILSQIPSGVDVLVVLAHVPNWMTDPANWIDGNPRKTWVEKWLRPTVSRYANTPGIIGWEVWNEPDFPVLAADGALGLTDPANYYQLLSYASPVIRSVDPDSRIVLGATRSIQQNFSQTVDYNRAIRDLGAQSLVDVWGVHYYGTNYENVVRDNGVADFLNGLSVPIWVTESGIQGPNEQLAYVERTWPFLQDEIPGIERFYYYQHTSTEPIALSYGLRNTDPNFPVSDLYVYLRDRS